MSLVLVVDDEPAVLEVLEEVLGDLGHEVLRAYDGLEALAVARARHPDLVVTDHMMPRLSGADLCKALRDDPELEAIPAIMLSAALTSGVPHAQAFLSKPFELTEFENVVERVLRESKAAPRSVEASRPAPHAVLREVASQLDPVLTRARAALDRLGQGADGAAKEALVRELETLDSLRASLADAAALSEGAVVLERERADLGALLRASVRAYQDRGAGEVSLSLPEDPVHLSVDRKRLAQLVDMLLRAVGAKGDGAVRLKVTQVPGEANATLSFTREGAVSKGVGPLDPASIDLYVAGALARLHRGTLWVDAAAPQSGASLRVVLPRT